MKNVLLTSVIIFLSSSYRTTATGTTRRLLIKTVNQGGSTWTAGENFPEDVTTDDLKRLNGALGIIHPDSTHKMEVKTHKITRAEIPGTFDARENWPNCTDVISNVRDQGKCGSCWSFAASEAMSDRLCIETGVKFQFAPQDLLECCSSCVPARQDTCGGGYLGDAWVHWTRTGVVSGGDYDSKQGCKPYSASAFLNNRGPTTCKLNCDNNYNTKYSEDKKSGSSAYSISQDVQQIQREIMENGPVTAIYRVYEDFYNYRNGVYQHVTGQYAGNHAVKIIGWGSENGVPYWLVANSWGKDWGDLGGFFKILRGKNHCLVEQYVVAGRSSSSVPLPRPIFMICIALINLALFIRSYK